MRKRIGPDGLSRRDFIAAAGAAAAAGTAMKASAQNESAAGGMASGLDGSSFGEGPDDQALREAWDVFCERLRTAGYKAFKEHNPASPLHRADAFRFLTQNLGQAFDLALETKDTRFPVIHAFCTPFRKLGGDNADCVYQQAWIDGSSVYKISGNVGTVRFLNFAVQGPRPETRPGTNYRNLHEPFGDIPEANLVGQDMETSWDGSFELYIGGPKRGPNWLPTTPGTRKLFIRQYFDSWDEEPARLRIERVGMTEPRPMPTPEEMIEAMDWAGRFVTGLMNDWPDWTYAYSVEVDPENPNVFAKPRNVENPVYNPDSDKHRGRTPQHMCWKLEPDEALVIEFDHHDDFWMMTNMGVFFNSMDFLYRPVSYTPSRTKVDSDGKVRLVLAHEDPGYHNWIDTQGFEQGNLTNRNVMSNRYTEFRTKVVKHSELASVMPRDAARVTPEDRARLMLQRFRAIQRRYSL